MCVGGGGGGGGGGGVRGIYVQCVRDYLQPMYMHVFVYSCLAGLRVLQKNGHLPTDASLFREYARFYAVYNTHTASLLAVILVVHTLLVFSQLYLL